MSSLEPKKRTKQSKKFVYIYVQEHWIIDLSYKDKPIIGFIALKSFFARRKMSHQPFYGNNLIILKLRNTTDTRLG